MVAVYSIWITDHGSRCVAVCDTPAEALKWLAAFNNCPVWIETTYRKGL